MKPWLEYHNEKRNSFNIQGGSAEVSLETGKTIRLSLDPANSESGTVECIYVDYKNITKVLDVGGIIYVDDGLISLRVEKKGESLAGSIQWFRCPKQKYPYVQSEWVSFVLLHVFTLTVESDQTVKKLCLILCV